MATGRRPGCRRCGFCRGGGGGAAGQATVELALVLPVLLLFALVVVQAGLVAHDLVLVHHAAREAARAGAVEPDPRTVRTAAVSAGGLDASRLSVGWTGAGRGQRGRVDLVYRAPTSVPLVGALVGDIELRAHATVRIE